MKSLPQFVPIDAREIYARSKKVCNQVHTSHGPQDTNYMEYILCVLQKDAAFLLLLCNKHEALC